MLKGLLRMILLLGLATQTQIIEATEGRRVVWEAQAQRRTLQYPVSNGTVFLAFRHSADAGVLAVNSMACGGVTVHKYNNTIKGKNQGLLEGKTTATPPAFQYSSMNEELTLLLTVSCSFAADTVPWLAALEQVPKNLRPICTSSDLTCIPCCYLFAWNAGDILRGS